MHRCETNMNNKTSGNDFHQLIQLLADNIEIDELAERLGLPVKKVGDKAISLCIEHNEKNPSMQLYKISSYDRSHYHCFSCHAHGDIFKFVQKVRNIDFTTAVRWLAETYGYTIPKQPSRTHHKTSTSLLKQKEQEKVHIDSEALEAALKIYRNNSSKELEPWLKSRKFTLATSIAAEISLASPRALSREIESHKGNYGVFRAMLEQFESSGLIRRENSDLTNVQGQNLNLGDSYRDFFYDQRVIFPMRDENKKLVGFAGRKTKEGSKSPKYLYSPKLPKSSILYRYHEAFSKIKSLIEENKQPNLYVCEGLLDCLRLEKLGYAAVAILGSSLSEHQAQLLINLANTLPEISPLRLKIFLDRDQAGLKGSALSIEKILNKDTNLRIEVSFIWTLDDDIPTESAGAKDPDELLSNFESLKEADAFLEHSTHPAALALVSERLKISPSTILDDAAWTSVPDGAKFRVGQYLSSISQGFPKRLLVTSNSESVDNISWTKELANYSEPKKLRKKSNYSISSGQDQALKLNLARELAQSGANKGEVLSDIAAWRRLSLAATAFNEGFSSRLKQNQFQPIEPFDAVHVSRGFGKNEPRLKSMPCPEDLVIQQYIINELLSEQLDESSELGFSRFIPAVRFYRDSDRKKTTGEPNGSSFDETLSFAYQIDMDVLEGRHPPSSGGIFRPFFDCWKEFIASLLSQGEGMSQVHMIRLDLKRYYDNIKRSVMKGMLQDCINSAFEKLDNSENFAPLFQPAGFTDERNRAVVDFLVDQSFGFHYYHPDTGEPKKSDRERGIPQGPVLSAWLGNSLLFKLDSKIRSKLVEYNRDGQTRAGYARYVDDVVIISDSLDVLNVLRAIVEDVTNSLGLEMVPKESFAPMSAQDFLDELTSGRALAVSGPREETEIFEVEDFEFGWGAWQDKQITRQNALELLRDPRLYQASTEIIKNQIFTALRASDLRPSELAKAARWIWYISAVICQGTSDADIIGTYWGIWNSVCQNLPFELNKNLPWDDPSFYALEGLQNLLERANKIDYGSDPIESNARQQGIIGLARAASDSNFFKSFYLPKSSPCPDGWGLGTQKLKRMFVQRVICIQWMASQLSSQIVKASETDSLALEIIEKQSARFRISLKRAIVTDIEANGRNTTGLTVSGDALGEWNLLHDAFLWLHNAIVCLTVNSDSNTNDPLAGFAQELNSILQKSREPSSVFALDDDNYLPILKCLLPSGNSYECEIHDHDPSGEAILLALQTFAAITPREALPHLLVNRNHLLQNGEAKIPFPPLPGIPASGLLLYSSRSYDSNWVKISKIWWVTLPSSTENSEDSRNPTFKISTADSPSQEFVPDWKTVVAVGKLEIFEAELPEDHKFWSPALPPRIEIDASKLKWIANAFEAIARINKVSPQNHKEYVPAWPYLLTSNRPDQNDENTLIISLLTPSYPTVALDGLAFVRDGSRGLRTIEIPEQYGQFWRTGVFLSELSGFRRDIDTFAELGPKDADTTSRQELLEPATHLLRNVLRKLRGAYFKNQVLSALDDGDHLPATVTRSLELLRGFPFGGELREEISYVISSEAETAAMHIRLSGKTYPFTQGLFSQYIEKIALKVLHTIPTPWGAELADSADAKLLETDRIIPTAYFELSQRFSKLKNTQASVPLQACSLSALIVGCKIAAISSWARELAFAIHALGEEDWPFPAEGELTETWEIAEKGFLIDQEEDSILALNEYFIKQTKANAPETAFTKITPLGWLALALCRIGLSGAHKKLPLAGEWDTITKNKLKRLVLLLSKTPTESEKDQPTLDGNWPFEFNHDEIFSSWHEPWVVDSINCLYTVEANLKLRTRDATGPWKLNSSENSFKSISGEEWSISRWQIALSGGVRPERVQQGSKFFSTWQETYNCDGNLILVSARNEKLSRLLTLNSHLASPLSEVDEEVKLSSNDTSSTIDVNSSLYDIESNSIDEKTNTQERLDPTSVEDTPEPTEPIDKTASIDTKDLHNSTRKDWRSLQERVWDPRQQRSPGHVRIAIMQWDVNDTYRHPIVDSNDWSNELPPKNTGSSASRNELRRRKFISEALSACKSFRVDLLVIPEYSVRPDTIKWLREQVKRKPDMPAVLAGTYKLYGNTMDTGFAEVHDGILGLADHLKTFSTSPPSKPMTYMSGEHSSILTLIAPLKLSDGERIACTFSRRKKYSSLAASEVFSPLLEPLSPLFSPDFLLSELRSRDTDGARTAFDNVIKPEEILDYSQQLRHLLHSTEFICSELFLPMSPVNYRALAAELRKQAIKFGRAISSEKAEAILIEDLVSMSKYLGLSGDGNSRRSIILVPAMTSRSADYWIFGQATLLSGGATTVFCNAVCKKQAVGGSCFIGRESWTNSKKSIFHDLITPYAGWSKGIYYNNPNDALGQTEQAIVIADVDPSFMQEGKPRPQALAVPLQLVAYLPIAELTEKNRDNFYLDLKKSIALINAAEMSGRNISPEAPGINETRQILSNIFEGEDLRPLKERYEHWRDHWRANPTAGIPPVITDWLTVDLFDEIGSMPNIFIPPYPSRED